MARWRRSKPTGARSLLVIGGFAALIVGLQAIVTYPSSMTTFPVAAALLEALMGSILMVVGVLLADRSQTVVVAGLVGGSTLVITGSPLGLLAGAGALAAGVWAYAIPWKTRG